MLIDYESSGTHDLFLKKTTNMFRQRLSNQNKGQEEKRLCTIYNSLNFQTLEFYHQYRQIKRISPRTLNHAIFQSVKQ